MADFIALCTVTHKQEAHLIAFYICREKLVTSPEWKIHCTHYGLTESPNNQLAAQGLGPSLLLSQSREADLQPHLPGNIAHSFHHLVSLTRESMQPQSPSPSLTVEGNQASSLIQLLSASGKLCNLRFQNLSS